MKTHLIFTITGLFVTILFNAVTWAGEIESGTLTIGASSDALFRLSDNGTNSFDQKAFGISTEIGYFVVKNFELGSMLSISYNKYNDGEERKCFFLVPYTAYHWSLSEKSNMYVKLAGGYGISDSLFDLEQTLALGEIGLQYFVAKNIAIGLSLAGEQTRVKIEDESFGIEDVTTYNDIVTQFKFRLYF